MLEILPIRILTDEDALIFGNLNVKLGKLKRLEFPVANGIVVSAPEIRLKTVLEQFEYKQKQVFEQTLTLIRKELEKTPVPAILVKETKPHSNFLVDSNIKISGVKELWITLLGGWVEEIKKRLWKDGFYPGITQNLEPKLVIFIKKLEAFGIAFFDSLADDVVINTKQGKLHPNDLFKLDKIVKEANKKLLIPHEFSWILDDKLKLVGLKPYTLSDTPSKTTIPISLGAKLFHPPGGKFQSAVKVYLDMSAGIVPPGVEPDGIYLVGEKIYDLNKPESSFEELIFKLVETANSFPSSSVLLKLADMSEGMGKIRGTLRLIHQKSLLDPLCEAVLFARNKKDLLNIHIVIPFVRGVNELQQIKKELATKKLMRKNSLQVWMEIAVPENIINLEEYLLTGVDGIVLNLDELSAHLSGYDHTESNLSFYKHEVAGLLKFLEDGIKLLHKSKVPFIAYGSLALNPQVLDYLVEKGVYGIVAERFEAPSMVDLLKQAEKRMVLRMAT